MSRVPVTERFTRRAAEGRVGEEVHADRRHGGRGGRRRGDRGRPWWQKALLLGAVGAAIRYWRYFGRGASK